VEEGEWGLIQFDWVGGQININGWGNGYTTGETGEGIGDMLFSLLEDDGSSFYNFRGAYVASNDDSYELGWNDDGSIDEYDPFIDGYALASGSYLLAISRCCARYHDLRDISKSTGWHGKGGKDYQVTFSDGVIITALNGEAVASVPEPSSIVILGLGLACIGISRKKKALKKV